MNATRRLSLALSGLALLPLLALLAACGGGSHAPVASASPAALAVGSVGPGFVDATAPPLPEATITPAAGSWDHIRPKAGYRVALVVDGVTSSTSAETAVLHDAVTAWSHEVRAHVTTFTAPAADHYVATIQQAIDAKPDLVISVGNGLVDPLAMVSAPNLQTQFLVLGAEIAEPTENVTAADWHGAMYRGEGLGIPEAYDPASFTPDRAGDGLRAGVAAVLSGITGVVVSVG